MDEIFVFQKTRTKLSDITGPSYQKIFSLKNLCLDFVEICLRINVGYGKFYCTNISLVLFDNKMDGYIKIK